MSTTTETERPVPEPEIGAGVPTRSIGTRIASRLGQGSVQVVLIVIAVSWLVPVFGLLISSVRPSIDSSASGWWTIFTNPGQFTLQNYADRFADSSITTALFNTVLITVPSTILVVLVGSLAAYALAWIDFPGRDWVMIGIVGLLVVPLQIALIPIAEFYGATGLFGTITGVVLFHVAFGLPFAIFLLRNYFSGIPRDLLEAARMDGASEWSIFRRVVLPIGLPAIASLSIFQFLWVWNDLLVALVFAGQDSAPITVALRGQLRQFGSNIDILASGSFISIVVPLLVFFSFQRYFVQGVLAGSTK